MGQWDDLLEELRKAPSATNASSSHIDQACPKTFALKPAFVAAIYTMEIYTRLNASVSLRDLRRGEFDTLIGINLLREGLDLPEVSLVAILDADKEGYLRSATALIQTTGAVRHVEGRAIFKIRRSRRAQWPSHRRNSIAAARSVTNNDANGHHAAIHHQAPGMLKLAAIVEADDVTVPSRDFAMRTSPASRSLRKFPCNSKSRR